METDEEKSSWWNRSYITTSEIKKDRRWSVVIFLYFFLMSILLLLSSALLHDSYNHYLRSEEAYKKRLKIQEINKQKNISKIGNIIIVNDTLKIVSFDESKNMFVLSNGMYSENGVVK